MQGDRAQIESAQLMLDYAQIKSPIDGVTGIRLVDPGNLVHASDTTGIVVVTQLDPSGAFFAHDKVEGVATTDGGRTLYISNDNDFGIDTIAVDPSGLWTVHQKTLPPTGEVDHGVILKVDMTKLPATTRTATVTIRVK
jgi:multidrug efflux pump subunit AcrA (membrane-fusion protein)